MSYSASKIQEMFDEWLIDHPEYHPDDDRSEAIDKFSAVYELSPTQTDGTQ